MFEIRVDFKLINCHKSIRKLGRKRRKHPSMNVLMNNLIKTT